MTLPDLSYQSPHLDAIALVHANRRHDGDAVERILAAADLPDVALVLAQMVQTAVRTDGMSVESFLDLLTDKTVEAAGDDIGHER